MELTAAVCVFLQETAEAFHGARRRRFMAETVEAFGLSQRQAERELGWTRDTIRKEPEKFSTNVQVHAATFMSVSPFAAFISDVH